MIRAGGEPPAAIDLGGRTVRVTRTRGHTPSDLAVELDDPAITFCGDLVWHGMFPNYVDAAPSALATSVRALRQPAAVYVPGHGPAGREAELDRYLAMLEAVEAAARAAHRAGTPAADAAAAYVLPASLGAWTRFRRAFHERAFVAWYRELGA